MNTPTPEAVQHLVEAAAALLEARANQMVTRVEWQRLRDALAGCGRDVPLEDAAETD